MEIVEVTANASSACGGDFRLRGTRLSATNGSRALQIATELENVQADWVLPAGASGPLILLPPLESEIHIALENSADSASVKLGFSLSPQTIGADLSGFMLQTGLKLLPPESCEISDKQLAITVLNVYDSLDEPVTMLLEGNLLGLRASLAEAVPRLYKNAAESLEEAGVDCGERYFKELALRNDVIDEATYFAIAWVPQTVFSLLGSDAGHGGLQLNYEPLQPEETFRTVGVRDNDVLNIRARAGVDNPIIGTIPPDGSGIRVTGPPVFVGPSRWVPIEYKAISGWVNFRFLEHESQP